MKKLFSACILLLFFVSLTANSLPDSLSNKDKDKKTQGFFVPSVARLTGPTNTYLEVAVAENGNFTCGIPNGPILLYGHNLSGPWSSATTIRVDNVDYWNFRSALFGTQVTAPYNINSTTNQGVWDIGDLRVTQKLQLVNGSSGNADTLKISYILNNMGTDAHSVGIRVMLDTMLGSNDGAPFRVPNIGEITTEKDYIGTDVPIYWEAFENLTDPNSTKARGTLMDSGSRPDRIVFANWWNIKYTPWDLTLDPLAEVTGDSAVGIYWNPVTLQPGQSLTRTTYYGVGELSVIPNVDDIGIGMSAPSELSIVNGNYSPNPFPITVYVANDGSIDITNIKTTLTLPAGLVLESDSLQQTIATVAAGDTAQVTWNVRATGTATGNLNYSVNVMGTNLPSRDISRDITVPPLPVTSAAILSSTANPSTVGQSVTFMAKVTPQLPIPTGEVTFTIDGTATTLVSLINGQATYTTTTLTVGNHTVTAKYSGDNHYLASNGTLTQVVNPATTNSDFVVTKVTLNPVNPTSRGTFSALVTVKNQGTAAGNGGYLDVWVHQPTAQTCSADGDGFIIVGTLAAGASKTFTISDLTAGSAGAKTLRAFVDSGCQTVESSETNNQRTLAYTVNGPDFVVTDVTLNPAIPKTRTTFDAIVTLKNQGKIAGYVGYVDVWSNQSTARTCPADGNAYTIVGTLPAGATVTFTVTGLSAGAAGNKILRVFADSYCQTMESNEVNNQLTKAYSVTP
ncbi:putative Ig-like domain (Group 3) [Gammaproteobacteria bacterium]